MVMLPGELLAALAVETGDLIIEVIKRSSASAGVEIPASNKHASGRRLTKSSFLRQPEAGLCAIARGETAMPSLWAASDKPPQRGLHSFGNSNARRLC